MPTPSEIDSRPPVAVGHMQLPVHDVSAAAHWLERVGLRPIVIRDDAAVLELRGGTHVVVRRAEAPAIGNTAPFDLMVDDIDAAHQGYEAEGLSPSPINRGRGFGHFEHDTFELPGPEGWSFTVYSSHVGGRPV